MVEGGFDSLHPTKVIQRKKRKDNVMFKNKIMREFYYYNINQYDDDDDYSFSTNNGSICIKGKGRIEEIDVDDDSEEPLDVDGEYGE